MITANHKSWADHLFRLYLNRIMKRHFYALHLLDPVPEFDPDKPLLVLPNHSSWWDGFFIFFLNKTLIHRAVYLMMLERQLKNNRFFRYLGAYSIHPNRPAEIKQSLFYTAELLNRITNPPLVCVFPQGELLPWHLRPVRIKPGLEFILSRIESEIQICHLGIRIETLDQQRPDVFFRFSAVRAYLPGQRISRKETAESIEQLLDQLQSDILRGRRGRLLFRGRPSINDRFGKRDPSR